MKVPVKRCSSCNARIIWTETVYGRRMPIDAAPVEDGNLRLELRAERNGNTIIAHYDQASLFNSDAWSRYVSHFATCKNAKEWRRA